MKTSSVRKKGSGGKREGSGRKPLDTSYETIMWTARLTEHQKATLDMLGGIEWLRFYLDSVSGNQKPVDVWK